MKTVRDATARYRSLDDREADTREARVEVLDLAEALACRRGVVLVMLGPADEAAVERVAEASRAATRIAGIHVLAARSQVTLEIPPASIRGSSGCSEPLPVGPSA